ncbi:MAG: PIN domain-containing protein [Candidatus Aenigmatarchaeota archaeon]
MKIYLDTNILFGYFKRILESKYKLKPFEIPEKINIIKNAKELYISDFVLAELIIEIKNWCNANNVNIGEKEIENLIEEFKETYNVRVIKNFKIKHFLELIYLGVDLKDSIHLEISRNKNMVFLTDDKELYEISKHLYGKVLNFYEFKRIMKCGPTQN